MLLDYFIQSGYVEYFTKPDTVVLEMYHMDCTPEYALKSGKGRQISRRLLSVKNTESQRLGCRFDCPYRIQVRFDLELVVVPSAGNEERIYRFFRFEILEDDRIAGNLEQTAYHTPLSLSRN